MKKKEAEAEKPEKEESGNTENETVEKAEESKADNAASKLKELETENAELKDKFLRKHADFENFRKRMFKEKERFN